MEIAVIAIVLLVLLVLVWGGLRRDVPHDGDGAEALSRHMDAQFKKPPNEGGLL